MYQLKEIHYKDIEKYDGDYCRRSGDLEVPEGCAYYGVYCDTAFIGYFAIQDGQNDGIFIRRGYLLPKYRCGRLWKDALKLLEKAAVAKGFRNIEFLTYRNPIAYQRKFLPEGYKIRYAGFIKQIGE